MQFRSSRLTALFGASPETVSYAQLEALTLNPEAVENEELDYKRTYDAGDEENDKLAVDIATFANHRGGVIILGMAEDGATSRATKAMGVELTDNIRRRITSTAAQRIFPTPQFDLRELPDPSHQGKTPHGLLLIIIPPSGNAPHAVAKPGKEVRLAYPRRHLSKKVWLSESDVAAAYRRRFTAAADQQSRVAAVEADVVKAIHAAGTQNPPSPLLTLSLASERPGDFEIDRDLFHAFQHESQNEVILLGSDTGGDLPNVSVASGRLVRSAGDSWRRGRAELHTDGAGSLATHLTVASGQPGPMHVWDSEIVWWAASALRFLAVHARERAQASGVATITVSLSADSGLHKAIRNIPGHVVPHAIHDASVVIATSRPAGSRIYGSAAQAHAVGRADVLLDDLADGGQGLSAATERLTSSLFLAYDAVGVPPISRDGTLHLGSWATDQASVRRWAEVASIPTES